MEFIEPNVELWTQGDSIEDIWKHIARCVRVCYQSTPKDPNENEESFVKRVILRNKPMWSEANHLAMLEHGTIYLKIPFSSNSGPFYERNKYSKVVYDISNTLYVTTNLRVLVENNKLDNLQYLCSPELHAKRYTFCFTTNIGVSREFNRHRVNSIAEESTRYCNYSKKNDGQIKIGLPVWLLNKENLSYITRHQNDELSSYCQEIINGNNDVNPECWDDIDFYLFALTACQWSYNMLIKKGWIPQQAREVLPLATKTQLVHTAFESDWKHFIALRSDGVSGKPHPNAKLLGDQVAEILNKLLEVK